MGKTTNDVSYLSQITLPNGTTYTLKDKEVEKLLGDRYGGDFEALKAAAWKDVETTVANDGNLPTGAAVQTYVASEIGKIVLIKYQVVETLPTASAETEFNTSRTIYLVKEGTTGSDVYSEYITINSGTSAAPVYTWEKIGDTRIDLSQYVKLEDKTKSATTGITVSTPEIDNPGHGDGTLAYGNTTVADSWTTTGTTPAYKADKAKLSATATQGSVTAPTKSAVTGYENPSDDAFVKSYPGVTSKMVTASITGVDGSTTASKATAGTAVNVAKAAATATAVAKAAETATDVAKCKDSTTTVLATCTVSGETLTFGSSTIQEAEANGSVYSAIDNGTVTSAESNGTITPYTFADVTVPVAATASTVATGELSASGEGNAVLTGLGTAVTANAITGLGTASTETFVQSVAVAAPTITIAKGESGDVEITDGISTEGTNTITASTVAGATTKTVVGTVGSGTQSADIDVDVTGTTIKALTVTDPGHIHNGFERK